MAAQTKMAKSGVILKPGREKPILNRHCWIFSGAISSLPQFIDGDILSVYSCEGALLGHAYFNRSSSIIGRMISFGEIAPLEAIAKSLAAAVDYRNILFGRGETSGYRLINGEGDALPGLVVDRFDDVLVLQIATLGMERLKGFIVQWLLDRLQPRAIYEKSNLPTRKEEGLPSFSAALYGEQVSTVEIAENGLRFIIDICSGQKTGFFFDQREMRSQVQALAVGKRVLNCFSYTGGFSVYALAGAAKSVDSVDISLKAMALARQNVMLNGFDPAMCGFYGMDVFQFLREAPIDYDFVILDPPAFAKKQKDVIAACRGYKEINRLAIEKMPPKSLLLSCSCSFHVGVELFQKVLFQAAVDAGRRVRIVGRHILAPDHPIDICHPEGEYLKSLLLYIE